MKRIIVDYHKLNEDILNLLVEKFPDGYDDDDIISFRNSKNEVIEAVEVRTDTTIYLVKVGMRLVKAMEDFADEEEEDAVGIRSVNEGSHELDFDDDTAEDDFYNDKDEDPINDDVDDLD